MNHFRMPTNELRLSRGELRAKLMPMLLGRVFHVTTLEAWPEIEARGAVLANTEGALGYSFDFSEVSALRRAGIVSLCDLRELEGERLESALMNYHFLNPRPMSSRGPVFLILSRDAESSVIPPSRVAEMFPLGGFYVAHLEAGMPQDMPLSLIERVIAVHVLEEEIPGSAGDHLRALIEANRNTVRKSAPAGEPCGG